MPEARRVEGPLRGLRVLDLSMLMPGPLCSMLLADWGADAIKVEPRLGGDILRGMADPVQRDSAYFLGLNRNKRSLAVDLRNPAGREAVRRLVCTADVLIEGFRPGKAAKLGLGYPELQAVNPRLIYLSLSAYGQDGPLAGRAGHDLNTLALAGLLTLLGDAGSPGMPGLPFADIAAAFMAAAAILASLWGRERTGQGRYLDATMHESSIYWLAPLVAAASVGVRIRPGQMGLTGGWPCYGIYGTSDGRHMALAAVEPSFWAGFCRLIGREDLIPFGRVQGPERDWARAEVARVFAARTQTEWVALLAGADVCCEPVLSLDEALAHPQAQARGLASKVVSLTEGPLGQVGVPVQSPQSMGAVRLPPPRLGEHTAEILRELAYGPEQIEGLVRAKAIGV